MGQERRRGGAHHHPGEARASSGQIRPRPGRLEVSVSAFLAQQRIGALLEGPRAELVGGRVVVPASLSAAEAVALSAVTAALRAASLAGTRVERAAPIRLSPNDLLRADVALVADAHASEVFGPGQTRPVAVGVGGSFDPAAALLVAELARGRISQEQRLPLYAAAAVREVWLLDTRRGWVEAFRSPWRGLYRSRTLWYPGERIPLVAVPSTFIEALPAP